MSDPIADLSNLYGTEKLSRPLSEYIADAILASHNFDPEELKKESSVKLAEDIGRLIAQQSALHRLDEMDKEAFGTLLSGALKLMRGGGGKAIGRVGKTLADKGGRLGDVGSKMRQAGVGMRAKAIGKSVPTPHWAFGKAAPGRPVPAQARELIKNSPIGRTSVPTENVWRMAEQAAQAPGGSAMSELKRMTAVKMPVASSGAKTVARSPNARAMKATGAHSPQARMRAAQPTSAAAPQAMGAATPKPPTAAPARAPTAPMPSAGSPYRAQSTVMQAPISATPKPPATPTGAAVAAPGRVTQVGGRPVMQPAAVQAPTASATVTPPPMVGGKLQPGAAQKGFVGSASNAPTAGAHRQISPWQASGENIQKSRAAAQEAMKRNATRATSTANTAAKATSEATQKSKPLISGWTKAKLLGGAGLLGAGYVGMKGLGALQNYMMQPSYAKSYGYQPMYGPQVYHGVSEQGVPM